MRLSTHLRFVAYSRPRVPNWAVVCVIFLVVTSVACVSRPRPSQKLGKEPTPTPTPIAATETVVPEAILDTVEGNSRGYMTTPQELRLIAEKASQGTEPYQSSVATIVNLAKEPGYWRYDTIEGEQTCDETLEPAYIGRGAPPIYTQALAYHLTGNPAYASHVRERVLDLTDTYGYGGEEYSGGNQCILNLSWYIPSWIMVADLIEDFPGWTEADKRQFQQWLAEEVYKKTAWSSRNRKNNWGSAGSATSAMIADYLWDSPYLLEGASPGEAYLEHKQNQLDRMGTTVEFDSRCDIWGIQSYGGIPNELERGSSGCHAQWLHEQDSSWTYTMTYLEGIVQHAELLLRRGDNAIYENIAPDGSGSLLRAIYFVINNPVNPDKSIPWKDSHKPTLEVAFRYYQDEIIGEQLNFGKQDRFIGNKSGQMLHFGTITHGFAPGEVVTPPPTVPPPGYVSDQQ